MATGKREDRIASVLVALFSVAFLMGAFFTIKKPIYPQQLGPDGFPKAIGFLMTALSIIYLFQAFLGKIKDDAKRAEIIGAEEKLEEKTNFKLMGLVLLDMVAYALLFVPLGFALSTLLALLVGILILDRKHLIRDLIISVVGSFGIYFAFTILLRVELPRGLLTLVGL
ncbi:MAG TPA: tripartite tricarboxylate transporter TctB family protein [Rectinemataceae bacterium]|nr:tripartite tricarboxylate transporter TctB family protein [Rectinemataceae bacterium]